MYVLLLKSLLPLVFGRTDAMKSVCFTMEIIADLGSWLRRRNEKRMFYLPLLVIVRTGTIKYVCFTFHPW